MKKIIWIWSLFLLFIPATVFGNPVVSGRYVSGGGKRIAIHIQIASPAPAAFIVLQHLPPGVKVLRANPKPAGINHRTGTVKWLFKKSRPGGYSLSLQLSKPVNPGTAHGEIRFRHPGSGKMISKAIASQ